MKISAVDAFQVVWDQPAGRAPTGANVGQSARGGGNPSAFVRITTDEGLSGLGEASPMAGGKAAQGCGVERCVAAAQISQWMARQSGILRGDAGAGQGETNGRDGARPAYRQFIKAFVPRNDHRTLSTKQAHRLGVERHQGWRGYAN